MSGFVPLPRDLPLCVGWGDEKFTRGQAWVDLLLKASYSQRCVYKRGIRIDLAPGQIAVSEVELARIWGWGRRAVSSFLSDLQNEQRIKQQKSNITSTITVCNDFATSDNAQQSRQQTVQQTHSKRTADLREAPVEADSQGSKKEKKKKEKNILESKENEESYKSKKGRFLKEKSYTRFMKFWDAFDYKSGKAEAADAWLDLGDLDNKTFDSLIAGAKVEASRRPGLQEKGRTPKMAQGWLSGRRWEDEELVGQTLIPDHSCSNCKYQGSSVCRPPGPCIEFSSRSDS